ncbi:MAG: hypothetical protein HOV81_17450 [Kofleriaceae bacterium]|nr:hypothetical protein [Kofleriaceae bacterium]
MRAVVIQIAACLSACATSYEPFEIQPALPTPIDVLVVLDDTPAMASHLPRQPPPGAVGIVTAIYNGAPDVRIAVTTSTTGTLRTSAKVPDGFIEHRLDFTDGVLRTNYQGPLDSALGSIMNVGTSSIEPNAIAASAQRALGAGFVRPSSGVGIFVVTASDDQSPDDIASYASAIQNVPNEVMVSAVYAQPAPRLASFVDAFAKRYTQNLDAYNMESLSVFSWLFDSAPNDYCLPVTPADPHGCELFTSHDHVVNPLPECSGSAWDSETPCYQLIEEPSCTSSYAVLYGGGYGMYHPRIIGRCAVD